MCVINVQRVFSIRCILWVVWLLRELWVLWVGKGMAHAWALHLPPVNLFVYHTKDVQIVGPKSLTTISMV